MRPFLWIALALPLTACGAWAQVPTRGPVAQQSELPMMTIRKVAEGALPAFRQLVTDRNYRAMGFDSPAEAKEVTLGIPLRIHIVDLARLKTYRSGENPDGLVRPIDQMLYPVLVRNQAKSSLEVSRSGTNWQPTEIGASILIKGLDELRKQSSDRTKQPLESYFVLRIPALNLEFLGYRANNTMMLTPLFDMRAYGWKSGTLLPAARVFDTILPDALKHNGLPR